MAKNMSLLAGKIKNPRVLLAITLLFILLLVREATSWRVVDDNNNNNNEEWEDQVASRARQLRELDQSGWRILAPASALPKPRTSTSTLRSRPRGGDQQQTDVSIVSVSPPPSTRTNKTLAIEWDDDDDDDNSNETDPFENLRRINPKINNQFEYLRQPKSSLGPAVKFEFKDSAAATAASHNKIQAPSQLVATSTSKLQGVGYFTPTAGDRTLANNHYKLIYHGQIKNGTKLHKSRVILNDDDVEFHLDTHKPLTISRRSFSLPLSVVASRSLSVGTATSSPYEVATVQSDRELDDIYYSRDSPKLNSTAHKSSNVTATTNTNSVLLPIQNQESSGSSSDWRPIVVSSTRTRRSGKTHKPSSRLLINNEQEDSSMRSKQDEQPAPANIDYKWKPITKEPVDKVFDLDKRNKSKDEFATFDEEKAFKPKRQDRPMSKSQLGEFVKKIEQPFDREDDESGASNAANSSSESDRDESRPDKLDSLDRWTPLETTTTTTSPKTTTQRPVNGTFAAESAQRSASDLNYIYSSQPVVQQQQLQQQQTSAGAAYYSNYLVASPQVQQQQVSSGYASGQQPSPAVAPDELGQVTSTIVDNTSGQTPEMIVDRAPQLEPAAPTQYGYSQPQSVAAFQPSRQPFNGNYANSYDTSSSYYNSMRALQQQQQQPVPPQPQPAAPPQAVRQIQPTPAAQVIRQEHHYHYHTPAPQPSAPERQLVQGGAALQSQSPSPAPTIIRELQPIMISQPVIQQQAASSTTPAPTQVIREIIREVPSQAALQTGPMMTTRFVMAQPEPQPLPLPPQQQVIRIQMVPPQPPVVIRQMPSVIRDSSPVSYDGGYASQTVGAAASPGYAAHSAKRLMRQLTNSMPQVAIRMPMPQFRLQVPAIQLPSPMRVAAPVSSLNLAPVTRQTGSFIIPPMPKKTTTLMTETQAMPTHTTIMQTTQFTPATRTTVYTTDHQTPGLEAERSLAGPAAAYKKK